MKLKTKLYIILIFSLAAGFYSCSKTPDLSPDIEGEYAVFAWNDLGMHCLNPTYDKLVILPPYNDLLAQVVKRGDPPEVVTSGITVAYKLINNTSSYDKRSYGGFWDNAAKLFGLTLFHDVGLAGNGLSGNMTAMGDHFIAEGIPVVPVGDDGSWNPYQVAEITVKNLIGQILIQTEATVPTSDEMNCTKCHGTNAYDNILSEHDSENGTNFSAAVNQPVLCASCHPSPALGIATGPEDYLSLALHGSHASRTGITCYDCHPGAITKCNRSLAHTSDNGNCIECHGTMAHVASTIESGRIPWAEEPACFRCHDGVSGVDTGDILYRKSKGHGNMYCSACHGSPHAMYPTGLISDNYQSKQYQGFTSKIKTIGSCGVCHNNSRGENETDEFAEVHGGIKPDKLIGCRACHTSISSKKASWPHSYTWKNSN